MRNLCNKEGSDKLIRLTVDVADPTTASGQEKPLRTIFTAVRPYGYTPEDFSGKQFFFITNLEYKKIMDEESQGMILAIDLPSPTASEGQAGSEKPLFISAEGFPIGAKVR